MLTAMIGSMALSMSSAPSTREVAIDIHAEHVDGRIEDPMESQLGQRLGEALVEEGLTLGEGQSPDRVVVSMRRTDAMDYEVKVHVERDGETTDAGTMTFSCKLCRVVEVQDLVLDKVPQIVDALRAEPEPDPALAPAQPELQPKLKREPTVSEPPKARVIGALGITGAVGSVAGLGGAIYGGVLLARGSSSGPDSADDRFDLLERHDRPGWTWFGVGLGTAAIGAALLAVDLTVLRRHRQGQLAFHPFLKRRTTGVALHLKF